MLGKLVKVVLLSGLLNGAPSGALSGAQGGLCAPAHANTTMQAAPAVSLVAAGSVAPDPTQPHPDASSNFKPLTPVRIVLLLPLRSDVLAAAAQAVRAGFLAAHERENEGISVTVFETGDAPQEVVSAYVEVQGRHDIVVGPLTRSDVTALAHSGAVSKPTIVLTQLEAAAESATVLPDQMLAVGLSVEDEGRQAANWAGAGEKSRKAFVISTNIAWQRRAARAFAAQWQALGLEQQSIELAALDGYLNHASLAQLNARLQDEKPTILFVALSAAQVRQMRPLIGGGSGGASDAVIYGTSQLNPLALDERATAEPMPEMNGVRLLDIPWQLQADHPGVMVYPHQVVPADQKRSADLERLYALGIDAYRVAHKIAARHTQFEIEGVTGALTVNFGKGRPSFKRVELPAAYQNGIVVPVRASMKSAQ